MVRNFMNMNHILFVDFVSNHLFYIFYYVLFATLTPKFIQLVIMLNYCSCVLQ